MVDPRLDKILKLIRLATSNPNVEEARSAALKAIQLMVELKVNISLPPVQSPPVQAPPQPPAPSFNASFDELLRQSQERQNAQAAYQQQWQAQADAAAKNPFPAGATSRAPPIDTPWQFWKDLFSVRR